MLEKFLRRGDHVLDIGANVGALAKRYAAAVSNTGRVLAVEPDGHNAQIAKEALSAYPWATVLHAAVTDTMGTKKLYCDSADRRRNSLWQPNVMERGETQTVKTVTLDHVASLLPNLKGIKIDAQGAEGAILAGGPKTLARRQMVWFVELWPVGLRQAGSSVEAVIQAFASHGWYAAGHTWDQVRQECAKRDNGHSHFDVVICDYEVKQ